MDPAQTQQQPTLGTNQPTPQPTQPLNQTALTLSRAIRSVESNGNYNAVGDNGQSHGAYQFNKSNFQNWATQYGLDPNDMSPTNQDHVAYERINGLLNQGIPPSQVAAIWNGATYKDGQYQAINPAYPQKVQQAYEAQLGKQGGGQSAQPQNSGLGGFDPNSQATPTAGLGGFSSQLQAPTIQGGSPTDTSAQPQGPNAIQKIGNDVASGNYGGAAVDAGKSLLNMAFPVVGDLVHDVQGKSDKSALQQLGDAGMSALWFLPFGDIADAIGIGTKALGASEAVGDAAGVIGSGAAGGYAGDVSSNLSQGKTGASAVKPGLGTLVGGGLGVAGVGAGALYNKFLGEQNVVDNVTKAYDDASGATKSGIKNVSKTASKGLDPNSEFLANAGIPPETQEINGRRVFTTGAESASQATLQDRINALTNLRDQGVAQSGATNNLEELRQSMLAKANQDYSGTALTTAKKQINDEMDSLAQDPKYAQDANGNIQTSTTNKIKSYLQGRAKYDAATPSLTSQIYGTMANTTKGAVEDAAESAGSPDIKALNKIIQQHIDAKDYLTKLNGQTVRGGRLGGYAARGVGALVGNALGGNNPITKSLATLGGEEAGGWVSRFMQKLAAGGPLSAGVLGRMATEDPQVVQKFLEYIGSQGGDKVAPLVKPIQQSSGNIIRGLMNRVPMRAAVAGSIRAAQ
jgi:hypothetical protein